eukprot:TRINITY_DN10022_c0_g1_i1.p1 TRINITY_DN10022_c0_g1~~TRINITY_DN10022_c0_g1_i1.p1  ORF type:complete len:193 (+),score=33.42 TRINITY_DN10022_c0_g1_i1:48-626(+)
MADLPRYTLDDVAKLCSGNDRLVMVIREMVYDLTEFKNHPGGMPVLRRVRGKDATKAFNAHHRWINLEEAEKYVIGRLRHEEIVLKGGSRDEANKIREELRAVGQGDLAIALTDEQLKSASSPASPSNPDTKEALSEIFDSLADPSTQTVTPIALKSFMLQMGAPAGTISTLAPRGPLNLDQFCEFINGLDV